MKTTVTQKDKYVHVIKQINIVLLPYANNVVQEDWVFKRESMNPNAEEMPLLQRLVLKRC